MANERYINNLIVTGYADFQGAAQSGTYTPTATGVANVASTGGLLGLWQRVGDIITVGFRIYVTPTAGSTLTQVGFSLPVASDLSGSGRCNGAGSVREDNISVTVEGDGTNDRAQISFTSNGTGQHDIWGTFVYEVEA